MQNGLEKTSTQRPLSPDGRPTKLADKKPVEVTTAKSPSTHDCRSEDKSHAQESSLRPPTPDSKPTKSKDVKPAQIIDKASTPNSKLAKVAESTQKPKDVAIAKTTTQQTLATVGQKNAPKSGNPKDVSSIPLEDDDVPLHQSCMEIAVRSAFGHLKFLNPSSESIHPPSPQELRELEAERDGY